MESLIDRRRSFFFFQPRPRLPPPPPPPLPAVAPFPWKTKEHARLTRTRRNHNKTRKKKYNQIQESIKSKRHLKSLLTSLKNSGKVKTTPNASGKSYGYSVRQGPSPKQKAAAIE